MDIELVDIAQHGLNLDQAPHTLVPEIWSRLENVRFEEGKVIQMAGWTATFGTPEMAPMHILQLKSGQEDIFWLYGGATKIAVYDGSVHTDLTGSSIPSASHPYEWSSLTFGGLPIMNVWGIAPQVWTDFNIVTAMVDLPDWTASTHCRILRAFGPFLVAAHLTNGSGIFPHLIRWSHPADPGALPPSWDIADPATDAGEYELPDAEHGPIQDSLLLRNALFHYKESSTWSQRFIGGQPIFAFDQFSSGFGVLAPHCVGITGDGKWHFVVTQDEILVHNGSQIVPLATGRIATSLFARIDTDNYKHCFVFCDSLHKEMWFCYPEAGATYPTRAFVWNYGVKSEMGCWSEVDVEFVHVARGDLESALLDTWDSESVLEWDSDDEPWSSSDKSKLIAANFSGNKFYKLDSGGTYDGDPINSMLQRVGLGVVGKKRNGDWVSDFAQNKFVKRVWPRVSSGAMDVRVGVQDKVDGTLLWSSGQNYNPLSDLYCDFEAQGVAVGVEFTTTEWFEFSGYKLEVELSGRF